MPKTNVIIRQENNLKPFTALKPCRVAVSPFICSCIDVKIRRIYGRTVPYEGLNAEAPMPPGHTRR